MKSRIPVAVLATLGMLAAAGAAAQPEVLKAQTCLNCHEADKKKVGPALKDIAKKGGDAAALTARIREGKGHPKVNKPEADIKAAVEAALASK